jgi:hypothetical protein
MNGHHLILGELSDYLTGETLSDTHDERYRQKIARLLIEDKRYRTGEVQPRFDLMVKAAGKRAIVKIDYLIELSGKIRMIVKYAPGSLVTRHRPAIAASRLVAEYQIPFVVVTNGEGADILDGRTSRVVSSGLASIPARADLIRMTGPSGYEPISSDRAQMESRIVYAFEVDGCCPCDDNICRLP